MRLCDNVYPPPTPHPSPVSAFEHSRIQMAVLASLAFLHFINITEPVIWELGEVPREIPGSRMTQVLICCTLNPL